MHRFNSSEYNEVRIVGEYIVDTNCTIRAAANHFGVSKSSVHYWIHNVIKYEDKALYDNIVKVLKLNLSTRHLRGGEATKRHWQLKAHKV